MGLGGRSDVNQELLLKLPPSTPFIMGVDGGRGNQELKALIKEHKGIVHQE